MLDTRSADENIALIDRATENLRAEAAKSFAQAPRQKHASASVASAPKLKPLSPAPWDGHDLFSHAGMPPARLYRAPSGAEVAPLAEDFSMAAPYSSAVRPWVKRAMFAATLAASVVCP